MDEFVVKENLKTPRMDGPRTKPSLNSMLEQKWRREQQNKQLVEPEYSEREQQLLKEAADMSLVGHLTELRKRIIIAVFSVLIGFGICYYFVDSILNIIIAPAGKLYYMRPTEAFFTYMKVALVAGGVVASPVILYQIWAFVMPAMTVKEKRIINVFLPVAIILFILGVLFSYFLVLPAAIAFFIGFSTEELVPMLSIGQYVDFVIAFILPFGFIFELPVLIIILASLGMLSSAVLKAKRKIFILLSFIIGAAVSPTPDVFSQTMIALPMIFLYEASLFIISKFMKK